MSATAPGTDKQPRPKLERSSAQDYTFYKSGGRVDSGRAHHVWNVARVAQLRANLIKAKAFAKRMQEKVEQRIAEDAGRHLINWSFEDFGSAYATVERYRQDRYNLRESLKTTRAQMLPLP